MGLMLKKGGESLKVWFEALACSDFVLTDNIHKMSSKFDGNVFEFQHALTRLAVFSIFHLLFGVVVKSRASQFVVVLL